MQLSIIVLSYNSDVRKMEATLKSVINQKNVDFEIIVSDDGSKVDPTDEIKNIFQKYNCSNYKININKENLGTVKNCLSAINLANGKYVYLISPGDMIFDDYTMSDFYNFAEEKEAQVCFGEYLNYVVDNDDVKLVEKLANPARNDVYDPPYDFFDYKLLFLCTEYILGPCYFRTKEFALKYLGYASKCCKYVEDNTSTAFALADNVSIFHYKRDICWYECNTGISTNLNSKWINLTRKDFKNTYDELLHKYPKDRIIKLAYKLKYGRFSNTLMSMLIFCICHPILFIRYSKFRKLTLHYTETTNQALEKLKEKVKLD